MIGVAQMGLTRAGRDKEMLRNLHLPWGYSGVGPSTSLALL